MTKTFFYLWILPLLFLILVAGCPNENYNQDANLTSFQQQPIEKARFSDLSELEIQYYIVSLEEAHARRESIKLQFDAMNQVVELLNKEQNNQKQGKITYSLVDAVLGRELDKNHLLQMVT